MRESNYRNDSTCSLYLVFGIITQHEFFTSCESVVLECTMNGVCFNILVSHMIMMQYS